MIKLIRCLQWRWKQLLSDWGKRKQKDRDGLCFCNQRRVSLLALAPLPWRYNRTIYTHSRVFLVSVLMSRFTLNAWRWITHVMNSIRFATCETAPRRRLSSDLHVFPFITTPDPFWLDDSCAVFTLMGFEAHFPNLLLIERYWVSRDEHIVIWRSQNGSFYSAL